MASRDEETLRRSHEEGLGEFGPLALDFETYAQRVRALTRRRLEACGVATSPDRLADALERTHARDLFLAIACDANVAGAWEVLDARIVRTLGPVAIRRGASTADCAEILAELPGDLCAPPPRGTRGDGRTRIGTYDGSGSLFAWLAVIVARRVADRHRAAKARPTTSLVGPSPGTVDGTLEAEVRRPSAKPLEALEDAEAADRFRSALGEAWAKLTDQEGLALLWKHRDGLSQRDVGRLLGVGESRVSRLVARAVDKLRSSLQGVGGPAQFDPGGSISPILRDALQVHLTSLALRSDILTTDRTAHG